MNLPSQLVESFVAEPPLSGRLRRAHPATVPEPRPLPETDPGRRPFLVIAHPGHELRIHGWLQQARPTVFVLTDGSGSTGHSRLAATSHVLADAGAAAGSIYGRFSDRTLYQALLDRDYASFVQLTREIAVALVRQGCDQVISDAVEGYNPAHDVCHLMARAAAALAAQALGRAVRHLDFLLVGSPLPPRAGRWNHGLQYRLDDAGLAAKLRAAWAYAELGEEVAVQLHRHRPDSFRVEALRPVEALGVSLYEGRRPFYERHGERQVRAGRYQRVLRAREHVLPLAEALRELVERGL